MEQNDQELALKGSAENSRQTKRKFGVEFLGFSIANLYLSIENISKITWAYIEMFWNENSGTLHYQNSTLVFFKNQKLSKNVWQELVHHI